MEAVGCKWGKISMDEEPCLELYLRVLRGGVGGAVKAHQLGGEGYLHVASEVVCEAEVAAIGIGELGLLGEGGCCFCEFGSGGGDARAAGDGRVRLNREKEERERKKTRKNLQTKKKRCCSGYCIRGIPVLVFF